MTEPSREAVGTLAEEALRFVDALKASMSSSPADAAHPVNTAHSTNTAHTGPECRVCPVCRGLAALRQVRPEAVEHLAVAMTELAQALREMVTPAGSAGSTQPRQEGGVASPRGAPAAGSVQHIDISD